VILFNGREEALKLDFRIKEELEKNPSLKGLNNTLCIILIGNNSSSRRYVDLKRCLCEGFGINVLVEEVDDSLSDEGIRTRVGDLCRKDSIKGIIIQLPLPRPSLDSLLSLIPEEKDVDKISPKSIKKFYSEDFSKNSKDIKFSPVIRAFKYFLDYARINPRNIETTIIGKGFLVGEPLGHFLLQQGAKVQFVLDYKAKFRLNCQLLVLSAGYPELVKGECISEMCNVVDFGSSVVNNKTIGDLDLKSAIGHLSFVSPSPGGMGPLVTRFLIMNFLGI
jgi:methylenetetrahydrofolate dehydrogenase (NADP+)/methenyltetrahydrofolate cyclohydrolase